MPILGREAGRFGDFLNQDEGETRFSDPVRGDVAVARFRASLSRFSLGEERLREKPVRRGRGDKN